MSIDEVELYKDYVANGGHIIATYQTSLKDQLGELLTDFALGELLGIQQANTVPTSPLHLNLHSEIFSENLFDTSILTSDAIMVKPRSNAKAIGYYLHEGIPFEDDSITPVPVVFTDSTAYFAENLFINHTSDLLIEAFIKALEHLLGEEIYGGGFIVSIDDIRHVIDETRTWYKSIEREFKVAQRSYDDIPLYIEKAYEDADEVYRALSFALRNNSSQKAGYYVSKLRDLTEQMIPGIRSTRDAETRSVWIDYQSFEACESEDDFRAIVRKLAEANINMIFPETVYNGATLYRTKIGIQNPKFQRFDFDPFSVVLDEAHKLGIEVHPWVWVFCGGYWHELGPVLKNNPEWVEINEKGTPFSISEYGTAWYNASHPLVREHLLTLFKELVTNYNVDGLHIDYIRYNEDDVGHFGYSEFSKAEFKKATGLDLDDIKFGSADWITFNEWRERNVTTFVMDVHKMLKETKPEALLSAAVVPDPDRSRAHVMQNWKHWVDNGYLDFVMTMDYRVDTPGFKATAEKGLNFVEDKAWVYPGLGLYVNDRINNIGQIKSTRIVGSTGVALFSNASFWKEKYTDAKEGLFVNPSVMPMREPFKAAQILLIEGAERLERASIDSLAKEARDLANEVSTWELNLENAKKLGEKTEQILNTIVNLKNERVIKSQEVEPFSSAFISVKRISNIYTYQNTEREYIPATKRTN